MILYVDGGCSASNQKDMSKRNMIAVVTDDRGQVLIEKLQSGGSNNIAELMAVKEALLWCFVHGVYEVELMTDSRNNLAWVKSLKVGDHVNDKSAVQVLQTAIRALKKDVKFKLIWIPRDENLAGHYIESKYYL